MEKKLSKNQTLALRFVASVRKAYVSSKRPLTEQTAESLCKLGLIELNPDEKNRRWTRARLTEKGKKAAGPWAIPPKLGLGWNWLRQKPED